MHAPHRWRCCCPELLFVHDLHPLVVVLRVLHQILGRSRDHAPPARLARVEESVLGVLCGLMAKFSTDVCKLC